jgi:hypothetical protein
MSTLDKITYDYGGYYSTGADRVARYIAVWRSEEEQYMDICKVIV